MFQQTNRGIWEDELGHRNLKALSPTLLKKFGLSLDTVKPVETLEELRNSPPNIIIAEAKKSFRFIQNYYKEQELKKKTRYVMGLGVFQQLQYINSGQNKLLIPAPIKFKNIFRPYLGQDLEDGESILVFRTGGIGDLLFIQPNLIYLKKKYPQCKIKFACGPQYRPMVETWDCIDELLELPFSLKELNDSTYHVLFEGVIERCFQAHFENSYNLFSKWMGLDLPDEFLIPKQNGKPELVENSRKILHGWGVKEKEFILMQLRASSPIRTPSHEFWLKIINELTKRGHKIVLTDSPKQKHKIAEFIDMCDNKDMIFNFCQYSDTIAHSIALTKLAGITLATDSSINHIAASLDVPCFGIYGPFPGFVRLKTYKKTAWVDASRHCGPCFIHGQSPCQYAVNTYSPCYNELIDTDLKLKDLIDKIEKLIKEN